MKQLMMNNFQLVFLLGFNVLGCSFETQDATIYELFTAIEDCEMSDSSNGELKNFFDNFSISKSPAVYNPEELEICCLNDTVYFGIVPYYDGESIIDYFYFLYSAKRAEIHFFLKHSNSSFQIEKGTIEESREVRVYSMHGYLKYHIDVPSYEPGKYRIRSYRTLNNGNIMQKSINRKINEKEEALFTQEIINILYEDYWMIMYEIDSIFTSREETPSEESYISKLINKQSL